MKYSEPRQTAVFDIETFRNYFAIGFECVETRRRVVVEKFNDSDLDKPRIAKIVRNWRIVGFNSNKYDIIMMLLAMRGFSNGELKEASDRIIQTDMAQWQSLRDFDLTIPDFFDHIDLCEVSPGAPQRPGLKLLMGRLHSKRLQDLPFDIDRRLNEDDLPVVRGYHQNDFDGTRDLFLDLKPQIELRAEMSDMYGVDLRSKSDAQIAEAVIRKEAERLLKRRIYPPEVTTQVFNYQPPEYIRFETQYMREVLHRIKTARFIVGHKGTVTLPEEMESDDGKGGMEITIGRTTYKLGIGGLHSKDKSMSHVSDERIQLRDRDVTSYYPMLIINMNLIPQAIGPAFQKIYRSIVERRVAAKAKMNEAKKAGNKEEQTKWKNIAETLKIVANGSFGKTGQPFSVLYTPSQMIQVTLTGQLSILMLVEELEERGFEVVSANTDGFVTKVPHHRTDEFNEIVIEWEWATGLKTEETLYKALHSRDVNAYIAIPVEGEVKLKGAFGRRGPGRPGAEGQKHNPAAEISSIAATQYLVDRTPIEDTIHKCDDVTKFVTVRRVNGGAATKDGELVGKVVRFYYSTDSDEALYYVNNGNLVPKSEGAKPLMELPDELPGDIDYAWYVREAYAILQDVGFAIIDPALLGRSGQMLARLPDEKNFHVVDLKTGIAICGKSRKSIRDAWIEQKALPEGHRLCSKCRKANEL